MDEPYFLAVARNIDRAPQDPYGFRINWDGTPRWAYETSANPPLLGAWIAFWTRWFPGTETSVHWAMLPFSLLALKAMELLCLRYRVEPWLGLVLLCSSPAFYLGSQVALQDVPMLAFLLTTLACVLAHEESRKKLWLIASVAAGFCCPLMKYNGLLILPLVLWLWLTSRRKVDLAWTLVAPLAAMGLWNLLTWTQYGAPHLLTMIQFENNASFRTPYRWMAAGVLSAAGLGVIPLSLWGTARLQSRRERTAVWVGVATFPAAAIGALAMNYSGGAALQLGLALSASVVLLVLTGLRGWTVWHPIVHAVQRNRRKAGQAYSQDTTEAETRGLSTEARLDVLLILWIVGTIAFQFGLMFTSVRYLVPIAPASILLLLKGAHHRPHGWRTSLVLLAGSLLVTLVAMGDRVAANRYRHFAESTVKAIKAEAPAARIFFAGHWGFQFYMEQSGCLPVDKRKLEKLGAGDWFVVASSAWPAMSEPVLQERASAKMNQSVWQSAWPLATLSCADAANFYGNKLPGCRHMTLLPFALFGDNSEAFRTFKVEAGNRGP